MVQPIPRPEAQGNGAGSGAPANPADVSFDKTGESDTILGYPCVKYVSKYKDSTSEIWITDQLGTFMGFGSGGGPMGRSRSASSSQPWEKMLVGKNFFPLRIVTHGTDGKESFRLEVTSVEKQSLPDSFFAPPEGFQKFDVGNMMRGMMPGGMPSGGRPPGSG